jgi:hypothetical protein
MIRIFERDGWTPRPVAQYREGSSESADMNLLVWATQLIYELKPDVGVFLGGDKSFIPVLRAYRENKKCITLMGFKLTMHKDLKESEYLRDKLVYLDKLLLYDIGIPNQVLCKLTLVILSELLIRGWRHLILGRAQQLVQANFPRLLKEREQSWLLCRASAYGSVLRASKEGKRISYSLNWSSRILSHICLTLIKLIRTLDRLVAKDGRDVPISWVLNELAPKIETFDGRVIYPPERQLLTYLSRAAYDIGALQGEDKKQAEGVTISYRRPNPDHVLTQYCSLPEAALLWSMKHLINEKRNERGLEYATPQELYSLLKWIGKEGAQSLIAQAEKEELILMERDEYGRARYLLNMKSARVQAILGAFRYLELPAQSRITEEERLEARED